jgi:hypothetical protein
MKRGVRCRLYVAISLGVAIVIAYYAVEFHRGYLKQGFGYFPLLVGFTDIPDCPFCDHIEMRSPLLEMLVLCAIFFGLFSIPLLFKKKPSG